MRFLLSLLILCGWTSVQAQTPIIFWKDRTVKTGEKATLVIVVPSKNTKHSEWYGEINCGIKRNNQALFQEKSVVDVLSFKDTVFNNKWRGTYEFMAWDSAQFQFPDLQLTIKDSTVFLPVPTLNVVFQKQKVDDAIEEIAVPKPEPERTFIERYWWVLLIVILVIAAILYYNIQKRSRPQTAQSLRDQTLKQINDLEKQSLWKKGKVEQHYVLYSQILRVFLTQKYQVRFTEKTSQEAAFLLKKLDLSDAIQRQIKGCLAEADLIKFGKADASEALIQQRLTELKELVVALSPMELPS